VIESIFEMCAFDSRKRGEVITASVSIAFSKGRYLSPPILQQALENG